MKELLRLVKVRSVHTFRSTGRLLNKSDNMVAVSIYMPINIWNQIHRLFGVDRKGKEIVDIPPANQLIWEQKNRKEKEK